MHRALPADRCAGLPESILSRISNRAAENGFDRYGAALSATVNACQAFSTSTGVAA